MWGEMRTQFTGLLLVLAFLHTGTSNARITVWLQRRPVKELLLTCNFSGDDQVSQINWDRVVGGNRSQLAVYHPQHGIHIPPEHSDSLQVTVSSPHSAKLVLKGVPQLDYNDTYCCTFITFPSGSLQRCLDRDNPSEAQEGESKIDRWLIIGGVASIPLVALLLVSVNICRRLSRRRVFDVQQTYLTETEDPEEMPHQPLEAQLSQDSTNSIYYIMVNADYQHGQSEKGNCEKEQELLLSAPSPLSHTTQPTMPKPCRKVYYLLGEGLTEQQKTDFLRSCPLVDDPGAYTQWQSETKIFDVSNQPRQLPVHSSTVH
ncbi:uncharacterized protein LOC136768461 isoform X2 [Amia ocellicauda]|uniref:uncharacterized protein LOC136768461 isoform X2 n=1 Tax=Amia ocellicauda TaxID=2972642 RepID=UPI00346409AB